MKRVIAIILSIVMVLSLTACNENKTIEIDGLKFTLLDDGTYSVEAGTNIDDYKDIVIPSKVNGIAVSVIANYAFEKGENIQTVTIENGITSIGEYAFENCENLTSITLPNTLTTIGHQAFDSCESLTSINVPDNVTTISAYCFSDCINLTNVNLPSNLITIAYCAFSGCKSIANITIPKSTKVIYAEAFANCTSLKSIDIPGTIEFIGRPTPFTNIEGLEINFSGTEMQLKGAWSTKMELQNKQVVHCTDGDLT